MPCNTSFCGVGQFRELCVESARSLDAVCLKCSAPDNIVFTSHGGFSNNCTWQCAAGFLEDCRTGECKRCASGQIYERMYEKSSPSRWTASCQSCPPGAECDGSEVIRCREAYYVSATDAILEQNSTTYVVKKQTCEECPLGAQICQNSGCFFARRTGMEDGCQGENGTANLLGTWQTNAGVRGLVGCPAGHEMISIFSETEPSSSRTQRCQRCVPELEYILDPGTDRCQPCPAGLTCHGDATLDPKVENSSWVREGAVFRLLSCPFGYRVEPGPTDTFNTALQKCAPCGKGEECTNATCTTCLPCAPGTYKAAVGTEPCLACPANTYRKDPGATELDNCAQCQDRSSTKGSVGQSNMRACVCDPQYYLITVNQGLSSEGLLCEACPRGALCKDGKECALRNSNFSCSDRSDIDGEWVLQGSGRYALTSCPAGFELRSTDETGSEELQECRKCLPSTYILRPDLDECQECPAGLRCDGSDSWKPVVPNSSWVGEGSILKLTSCPTGYSRISVDGQWEQQRCEPCGEGTECVSQECSEQECPACAAGKYKDVKGTLSCRVCPPNTYNPDTNAKDFASCRACPKGSDTAGLGGQTRADACQCGSRFYLADTESSGTSISCASCPRGLECRDGSCSIHSSLDLESPVCSDGSVSFILGTWIPVDGRAVLIGCPTGFRLLNQTGAELQVCQECADGKFMFDPREPGLECQPCPPQGVCPNKGRPIFNIKPLESKMILEGNLDEGQLRVIIKSIADTLGVPPEMVECDGFDPSGARRSSRRAPVSISFTVYVDPSQQAAVSNLIESDSFSDLLAEELIKNDISAAVKGVEKVQVNMQQDASVGTVALVDGVYQVVNCPQGFLLVNETVPGTCLPCERGTYSIDPFEGCSDSCRVRLCNECPEGAICSGGQDSHVANHFESRDGAQWEIEPTPIPTGGTMLRYRLSECGEGFRLIRGQASSYTRDKCEICEFGKLALGAAEYDPIHASYGRLDSCIECKELTGVECQGGRTLATLLPGRVGKCCVALMHGTLV